jgi:hypothetical protein
MFSLRAAAERSGQSVIRLGRWCATGQLRCERDGRNWLIPDSELESIADVANAHAAAVEQNRITALAVPVETVPPNLRDEVALRLGLAAGNVSITPLALDGVAYVVAVWRGEASGTGGLSELRQLAVELGADLLDGEVKSD